MAQRGGTCSRLARYPGWWQLPWVSFWCLLFLFLVPPVGAALLGWWAPFWIIFLEQWLVLSELRKASWKRWFLHWIMDICESCPDMEENSWKQGWVGWTCLGGAWLQGALSSLLWVWGWVFKGERWIRLTRWPAEMFDLYPQWWAVVICLDGNLKKKDTLVCFNHYNLWVVHCND